MKRRTFTASFNLPHLGTFRLTDIEGQTGVSRNPLVIGLEWKKELESNKWQKMESEIGKMRTQANFAASIGISSSSVREYLYLISLAPDVVEMFVSLGNTFPKGSYISKSRMRQLRKLPKNKQMSQAKKMIEDAGMDIPGWFSEMPD